MKTKEEKKGTWKRINQILAANRHMCSSLVVTIMYMTQKDSNNVVYSSYRNILYSIQKLRWKLRRFIYRKSHALICSRLFWHWPQRCKETIIWNWMSQSYMLISDFLTDGIYWSFWVTILTMMYQYINCLNSLQGFS